MEQKKTGKKALIVGILAAILILGGLLAVLLIQCAPQTDEAATTAPETTAPPVLEDFDLWWNMDRAEYDGKSEAGMSSRTPGSDGYFRVRFFKDGEITEFKVADRKLINKIDVQSLMALVFDDNGIVVDMYTLDELPCQKVGWQFFVQSVGGNLIKVNSAYNFQGMEVLLELEPGTKVYDMTGVEGEVGKAITPIPGDRIMAVADMEGKITDVFVYVRENYMVSHEAECPHCQKTVSWSEWVKTDSMPEGSGHYQIQNDITLKNQVSLAEDTKLCLDLNGKTIHGRDGYRVLSMHNVGVELAIMDTSEGQKGALRSHGEINGQGGVLYVRHGAFYFYSGTLDGSGATNLNNGAVMCVNKGTFAYINGGTVKGGTAKYTISQSTGKPTNGLGGNIQVSGKLVINDGLIIGGTAVSHVSTANGKTTYARGYGGNIYMGTGGVLEMNGGKVANGVAGGAGGNLYIDGTCELTINGGVIGGGKLQAPDRNGGNLYVGSKATVTMNGGIIRNGQVYNGGGNLYANGFITMNGGQIYGGKVIDAATGKQKTAIHNNVYVVNGKFHMYGGKVSGGVTVSDTSTTDNKKASVVLSGYATIYGAAKGGSNLTLSSSGEKVLIQVGQFRDEAKIGISTTRGVFTMPRDISEMDHFVSDIPGADVIYYEGAYALGKLNCICGKQTHVNGCDGKQLLWCPWTNAGALPITTGNYYLMQDVTTKGQTTVPAGNNVKLDLNGKNVTLKVPASATDGFRLYRVDSDAKLAITDTTDQPGTLKTVMPEPGTPFTGKILKETVKDPETGKETNIYYEGEEAQKKGEEAWAKGNFGMLLWARGGEITVHNGILDGSNLNGSQDGIAVYATKPGEVGGKVIFHGGTFLGGTTALNGNINITSKCALEIHGGTFKGGNAKYGGIVFAEGNVLFTGGTMEGGKASNEASNHIHVVNGTLEVRGGKIMGGVITDDREAGDGMETVLKLSGDPQITGAKTNLTLNNRGDGVTVYVDGLASGARIGLSGKAGVFSEPCDGANAQYFTGDAANVDVVAWDGALALGKVGCLCGKEPHASFCDEVQHLWAPWTGENLPATSGYWYLTAGKTLSEQSSVIANAKVFLDLNGYTVSSDSDRIYSVHYTGAELTITDTYTPDGTDAQRTGGRLQYTGKSGDLGAVVLVRSNAKLRLLGGTLDASASVCVNASGGAAVFVNTDAAFRMEGGTIKGGSVKSGNGGAVVVNKGGEMTLVDGTVTGGKAEAGKGGNISVVGTLVMEDGNVTAGKAQYGGNIYVEGKMILSGGKITGGTGSTRNLLVLNGELELSGGYMDGGVAIDDRTAGDGIQATLRISGDPVIFGAGSNLNLSSRGDGATVYVGAMKEGAKVSVNAEAGVISEPCAEGSEKYFLSDKAYMTPVWHDGVLKLGKLGCLCGQTTHLPGCDKKDHFWMPWGKDNSTLPSETGYWYLYEKVQLDNAPADLGKDQAVVLDLNGQEALIANSRAYAVANTGASLVITDRTKDGKGVIKVSGTSDASGLGIYVRYGTAKLIRGHLDTTAASSTNAGQGGVTVYIHDGTTFQMYGGSLKGGQHKSNNGGTVQVYPGGTMELYGGDVYGTNRPDQGVNGSAIQVGGTFIMEGGTVTGGTCTGAGGAICVKGYMELNGGTVTGGHTTGNGGNLHILSGGELLMTGGLVEKGDGKYGKNIYVAGKMTMKGGTVQTGNILLIDGTMTLSGGKVLGGLSVDDRSATDAIETCLTLTGAPQIAGLTLENRGAPCKLLVDKLTTSIPTTAPAGLFARVADGTDPDAAAVCFVSRNDALRVSRQADGLHMVDKTAVIHCLCGQTKHLPGCDGNEHTWKLWDSTTKTLPTTAGYWYLNANVEMSDVAEIAGNQAVVLDLNGQQVTRNNGRAISVHETGSSLVVTDSSEQGNGTIKITGSSGNSGLGIYVRSGNATWIRGVLDASAATTTHTSQGGTAVWINNGRTFTLYGGTVKGGVPTKCNNGGTVEVSGGGTMEMHGGNVVGSNAPNNSINGAAINNTGALKIYGGTVTGGTTKGVGGAICARGVTEIRGGIITDGTSGNGKSIYANGSGDVRITGGTMGDVNIAGKVSVSAAPTIATLTVAADKLTVGDLTDGASITVTGTGVVAKNVQTDVSGYFHSSTGLQIVYDAAAKTLTAK